MKRLIYLLASVFLLTSLGACTTYFPLGVSSGSSLQAELPHDAYTIQGTGEGTSCGSFFFGFPLEGEEAGTTKRAVNQAVADKGGDLLINSTTDLSTTHFLYLVYFERCVMVQGLVAKLK